LGIEQSRGTITSEVLLIISADGPVVEPPDLFNGRPSQKYADRAPRAAPEDQKVCAYFAICPTEVVRKDDGVSGPMAGGYSRIPGYLIARLAIDAALRGQRYGEQLLLDALGKAVAASEIGGGRLVVVDAIDDEAPSFYEHYHVVPVRNRERRLVMKVSTAAKALGERWRD
jgi:GNAT superfamily N-acetyltransferase